MVRGEVWWVDFDPSLGGEIRKTRPGIIVSNDASNRNLNRVQVVPVTSKISRVYPCEASITLRGELRKANGRPDRDREQAALEVQIGDCFARRHECSRASDPNSTGPLNRLQSQWLPPAGNRFARSALADPL